MAESTKADRDVVDRVQGLFIWYLNDDELESFERCIEDGYAKRSYEGFTCQLMGFPKVRKR